MSCVKSNLQSIYSQIRSHKVRLVAVSKLHPASKILEAYEEGQRHFGENYVDELLEKAKSLPSDIHWHMIGPLQSNKAKKLLEVPNLHILETLSSQSLAQKLNTHCESLSKTLNVLIQVNTSQESSKSGVLPGEVLSLASFMRNETPSLQLKGLMTIGFRSSIQDFAMLRELRTGLSKHLVVPENELELSMGMTDDYLEAIQHGSTSIRIGSAIFGPRNKP